MHWRMSSFRISSTSSASNSISSSPRSGCDLGSNRLGIERFRLPCRLQVLASCHGSKISLISATNAGISARKSALVSAASRKFRNFSPTR